RSRAWPPTALNPMIEGGTVTVVTDELIEANPLLSRELPIPFGRIPPEHVVPAIRHALAEAEREVEELAAFDGERTYANTVERLEAIGERLARGIRPVSPLTSVSNSPELREAYETVLPEYTAFYARLPLDPRLWRALRGYAGTDEARALA